MEFQLAADPKSGHLVNTGPDNRLLPEAA